MKIKLKNLVLKNPLMIASGTGGFGDINDSDYFKAGAFITKTITFNPRNGNPPPRIFETASGIMNFVGLENPGLIEFIKKINKITYKTKLIVSIMADNKKQIFAIMEELEKIKKISGYEINVSCPNVKHKYSLPFIDRKYLVEIVKAMQKSTAKFFSIKLPPYTGIEYSRNCEECGADAVTLNNTYPGLCFKDEKNFVCGGISGPAIKPLMLYNVYKTSGIVKIPVIASGGIQNSIDVKEAIGAGAKAVQIGSVNLIYPDAVERILNSDNAFAEN